MVEERDSRRESKYDLLSQLAIKKFKVSDVREIKRVINEDGIEVSVYTSDGEKNYWIYKIDKYSNHIDSAFFYAEIPIPDGLGMSGIIENRNFYLFH